MPDIFAYYYTSISQRPVATDITPDISVLGGGESLNEVFTEVSKHSWYLSEITFVVIFSFLVAPRIHLRDSPSIC